MYAVLLQITQTHLGHAFTYVSFDILIRYLRYKGYNVNYLQNATDINDMTMLIKQAERAVSLERNS